MPDETSPGVDVYVRVGDHEELHLATIRDVTSTSVALRSLAYELGRLAGPVTLRDRIALADGDDVYAEDLR